MISDAKSQGISNQDIYYVVPNQFGPRTLSINHSVGIIAAYNTSMMQVCAI